MKLLYPLVTADIALFTLIDAQLRVLLVQRTNEPLQGRWALPGGVLNPDTDATLLATAQRVLTAKLKVDVRHLEQVATFSGADRDPRGWSISTLHYALLPADQVPAVAGLSVGSVAWHGPQAPGLALAFDHAQQLAEALAILRRKVQWGALPLHLLPAKFTLTELQRACEAILGRPLDKGAFRRTIRNNPNLALLEDEFVRGPQRPAQLYQAAGSFRF